MRRVIVYIDGFNLYQSIDDLNRPWLKWLDLRVMAEGLLRKDEVLKAVKYFSAFATWMPARYARHRDYVDAIVSRGACNQDDCGVDAAMRGVRRRAAGKVRQVQSVEAAAGTYAGTIGKVLVARNHSDRRRQDGKKAAKLRSAGRSGIDYPGMDSRRSFGAAAGNGLASIGDAVIIIDADAVVAVPGRFLAALERGRAF